MRALCLATAVALLAMSCGSPPVAVDGGTGGGGGSAARPRPALELVVGGGLAAGNGMVLEVQLGTGLSQARATGAGLVIEGNATIKP